MVEQMRVELTTYTMRTYRSSQLSYCPLYACTILQRRKKSSKKTVKDEKNGVLRRYLTGNEGKEGEKRKTEFLVVSSESCLPQERFKYFPLALFQYARLLSDKANAAFSFACSILDDFPCMNMRHPGRTFLVGVSPVYVILGISSAAETNLRYLSLEYEESNAIFLTSNNHVRAIRTGPSDSYRLKLEDVENGNHKQMAITR